MGSSGAGSGDVVVRSMTEQDWPAVRDVCATGIATGHATFEAAPPTWEAFDATRAPEHRLVAVDAGGRVLGWAAVVAVSERCVYAGVVEHSVYVAPDARGRGVGRLLLEALITSTEAGGVWTIQSGVFPENTASLALHAAAGFRVVGVRERLGLMGHGPMAGRWRDVVLLERRSDVVHAVPQVGSHSVASARPAGRTPLAIGRLEKTVLDCPDPQALAAFYCAVLGMQVNQDLGDWTVIGLGPDRRDLAFQRVPDHSPPTWPRPGLPQQMHLDVRVQDPDRAEAALLALGARRRPTAAEAVHGSFRTFLDPAGHPFCVVFGRPPRGPVPQGQAPDAAGPPL